MSTEVSGFEIIMKGEDGQEEFMTLRKDQIIYDPH